MAERNGWMKWMDLGICAVVMSHSYPSPPPLFWLVNPITRHFTLIYSSMMDGVAYGEIQLTRRFQGIYSFSHHCMLRGNSIYGQFCL